MEKMGEEEWKSPLALVYRLLAFQSMLLICKPPQSSPLCQFSIAAAIYCCKFSYLYKDLISYVSASQKLGIVSVGLKKGVHRVELVSGGFREESMSLFIWVVGRIQHVALEDLSPIFLLLVNYGPSSASRGYCIPWLVACFLPLRSQHLFLTQHLSDSPSIFFPLPFLRTQEIGFGTPRSSRIIFLSQGPFLNHI